MRSMIFDYPLPQRNALRKAISAAYRAEETACIETLLNTAALSSDSQQRITERARALVTAVRAMPKKGGVEAFMYEYDLSSQEGIVLMCLAESLLRVPDARTETLLIEDKLSGADWSKHIGHSESLFVNASTWAFMLTGKLLGAKERTRQDLSATLARLLARTGEPIIREALAQAFRIIGRQFIVGRSIEEGLARAKDYQTQGYRLSFDMLGEAACTQQDADRFFELYTHAIATLGQYSTGPIHGPQISVKLSALEPRYAFAQYERVMQRLLPRLRTLAAQAKAANIALTIDAEESERLELQLDLIEALVTDNATAGWNGLGLAVQTYLKRASYVIDWLADLARRSAHQLMVRLVKGAYWDAEIKRTQVAGLDEYPVFTRKESTDVAYIACAKKLLANTDVLYPMFATHNAHTVATVLELAGDYRGFEFQRLQGMGEKLYGQLIGADESGIPCRIYAPCGGHRELLPYLVRRLLENGANTSFVNRIVDEAVAVEQITADPIAKVRQLERKPHPRIPLPKDLYGPTRRNAQGLDLTDERALAALDKQIETFAAKGRTAAPIINGSSPARAETPVFDPSDRRRRIGTVIEATEADIEAAIAAAAGCAKRWDDTPVEVRAARLERAAELLETHATELMALCIREAGKTLANAVAEVREAVDYCRYYALCAREQLTQPYPLLGLESIEATHHGCGVFVCISPWNFPLAIFTGQIAAALAAGNAVIAKPAEQTPLIAYRAVQLLHQAGIAEDVLQLVTGDGKAGARLVADPRVQGVAFTGGAEAAHHIRKALAHERRAVVPLIAETGGQNAMIVDSTALPEQAVADIVASAFDSAGQRCSALRVLFVQEDIANNLIELLAGAMAQLRIGDPALLSTDIGPVIDEESKARLEAHGRHMVKQATLIHCCDLPSEVRHGTFFAPRAYEIQSIKQLHAEHFGPVLHVVRYGADTIDDVIDDINAAGYGLTFAVHSRIDSFIDRLHQRLRVGNIYVNRNMIGAVVGVQPFGGEGLSGTGPKAGGPHYLLRFTKEQLTHSVQSMSSSDQSAVPANETWTAAPVIDGVTRVGKELPIYAYDEPQHVIGTVALTTIQLADQALKIAAGARFRFDQTPAETRAHYLAEAARRLTTSAEGLLTLCRLEAGLSRDTARREIEQAGAICRAYADEALKAFGAPLVLPGPTGERNEYRLHNRGALVCIAGDQQPILALTAMIAAALAAGNPVIALPAPGAFLIGAQVYSRFALAGVPADGLHYVPNQEETILERLLQSEQLAGVAHLGDEATTRRLDARLAARQGPIIPLIATVDEQRHGGVFANPRNLYRFATARTLSVNTTASGGNASLYTMAD